MSDMSLRGQKCEVEDRGFSCDWLGAGKILKELLLWNGDGQGVYTYIVKQSYSSSARRCSAEADSSYRGNILLIRTYPTENFASTRLCR